MVFTIDLQSVSSELCDLGMSFSIMTIAVNYSLLYFLKNQAFNKSPVIMYAITINNIAPRFMKGNGINPTSFANGIYGRITVMIKPTILKMKRYLPGLLLKKFL